MTDARVTRCAERIRCACRSLTAKTLPEGLESCPTCHGQGTVECGMALVWSDYAPGRKEVCSGTAEHVEEAAMRRSKDRENSRLVTQTEAREWLTQLLTLWRQARGIRRWRWEEEKSEESVVALGEAVGRCNMLGALLDLPGGTLLPPEVTEAAQEQEAAMDANVQEGKD